MLRTFLTIALSVGMLPVLNSPASAQFQNGNELLASCQAETGSFGDAYCLAYIMGAVDVLSAAADANIKLYGYQLCIPFSVTGGQVEDTVIRWLRENPSEWHYAASYLVAAALDESFPCR